MSETAEESPRRFRRLRILAAVVVVLAVLGAASRWLPRDSFVAEIERIGGRYRQQLIDGHFRALLKVVHRQPLTVFHWIDLEKSQADNDWLREHREDIQKQSDLCLFIGNPRITADGLAELRGLENIDVLDATGMPLNDSAVETFVSLPRLIQLYIAHTGISDTALAGLAKSPHLVFLSIDRTQATQAGIDGLKTCSVLSGLWIRDADNDCVAHVATFSRLTSLNLQGDQFTIESLAALKSLQRLEVLSLYDSKFTDAELDQLRQALPGCSIQQVEWKKVQEIREASWE